MSSLRIAYLSSEVAPFAKTGGLADVALGLPRALGKLGHDVRVFLPYYSGIEASGQAITSVDVGSFAVNLGGEPIGTSLFSVKLPDSGVTAYLVHCPRYYARPQIYTNDPDEPLRFLFFCRAVLESCQRLGFAPHVFHANDWQSALTPLLKKTLYAWDELFASARTLLTIHNLAYQGVFPSSVLGAIGLADSQPFDANDLRNGEVNFLKTGIVHADGLSTVSPTYASEIQGPEQGYGLDPFLRQRRDRLVGILNGVDYREWDPSRDSRIPFHYSSADLSGKTRNKEHLLRRFGLPYSPSVPLIGMVSRLFYQKGIELLYDALPTIFGSETVQLIVLGSGEAGYEAFFHGLERRFTDRVRFYRGFHDELAHQIEAAADMFLMPSRYEPCGLNQLYSLRYGTVPIVRRTGGLADSVRLFDSVTGEGTGIVFDHFTPDGVVWALRTAIRLYEDEPAWSRLVANAMAEDFSWDRLVERYVALYRELLID
ncbi:MAG TPA: glycogen/starch synthase [Vicinamibacteria bacterium]|nr:glycogen/starch synthase [Vicinamibacteria bacterium]